jgi:hypothetical protein
MKISHYRYALLASFVDSVVKSCSFTIIFPVVGFSNKFTQRINVLLPAIMIELKNVSKVFTTKKGNVEALKSTSLQVKKGDAFASSFVDSVVKSCSFTIIFPVVGFSNKFTQRINFKDSICSKLLPFMKISHYRYALLAFQN